MFRVWGLVSSLYIGLKTLRVRVCRDLGFKAFRADGVSCLQVLWLSLRACGSENLREYGRETILTRGISTGVGGLGLMIKISGCL